MNRRELIKTVAGVVGFVLSPTPALSATQAPRDVLENTSATLNTWVEVPWQKYAREKFEAGYSVVVYAPAKSGKSRWVRQMAEDTLRKFAFGRDVFIDLPTMIVPRDYDEVEMDFMSLVERGYHVLEVRESSVKSGEQFVVLPGKMGTFINAPVTLFVYNKEGTLEEAGGYE